MSKSQAPNENLPEVRISVKQLGELYKVEVTGLTKVQTRSLLNTLGTRLFQNVKRRFPSSHN